MRKIGIAVIGTLFLLATTSCNKDKMQVKPDDYTANNTAKKRKIWVRNDEVINPYNNAARVGVRNDENYHPLENPARRGVINDENYHPFETTAKTSTTIVLPPKFRNDENIDPFDNSGRKAYSPSTKYSPVLIPYPSN